MRLKFHPAVLFVVLYLFFLAVIVWAHGVLPPRVASHFDARGEANGWSTRDAWRTTSLLLGTALPVVALGALWVLRFVPTRQFNLPHREYWLGEERRRETLAYLLRHGWWLGCLELAFFICLEWLIVTANAVAPPRLATGAIFSVAGFFIVSIVTWILQMQRRFARPV